MEDKPLGVPVLSVLFTFVRHGETESNAGHIVQGGLSVPLNERGRSQAHALGTRFATQLEDYHLVFSSSNARASETTTIALSQTDHKGSVIELDTLTERRLGVFEGRSFFEAKKLLEWSSLPEPRHLHFWDKLAQDESTRIESKEAYIRRVRGAVATMLRHVAEAAERESHSGGVRVLCVSHGLTTRAMLSEILYQANQYHNPDRAVAHQWFCCDIHNCSVTQVRCEVTLVKEGDQIECKVRNATIVVLNDTSHVPKHMHNPEAGKTAN
jgi:broad specificity phosphatase PhoE